MQYPRLALLLFLLGCGDSDEHRHVDAAQAPQGAAVDAPPDAACEQTLLTGGSDVTTQGWTITQQGPVTITNGADYVELQTSTQSAGGMVLLQHANVPAPYRLQVVMQVVSVATHNQFDSGAAILGSFTAPFGTTGERSQMVYLDAAAVGWADDTQTHAATITDGAYHTYVLAVDAAQAATLTMDGTPMLTRANFAANGTIAIGDQTNDPNVDSTLRIRSVKLLLCP